MLRRSTRLRRFLFALGVFTSAAAAGYAVRASHPEGRDHGALAAERPAPRDASPSASPSDWRALPLSTRLGVERALADADAAYAPVADARGVRVHVPGGLAVTVGPDGGEVVVGGHRLRLGARRVGREGLRASALGTHAPTIAGAEARIDRGGGVVEWWRALRSGLEHGVTLATRPAGDGEVRVDLELGGTLQPVLGADGIALVDDAGTVVIRYRDLLVVDARGRTLDSSFEVDGDLVSIRFDDRDAAYPVVVDPSLYGEEQKLLADDKASDDRFGHSAAMSADGSRVVVGALAQDDEALGTVNNGAAYVFVRVGTSWALEQKLLASDRANSDSFGTSVAMSADGSRVAVGAPVESDATGTSTTGNGAVYVFLRSGSTWTQERKLLAIDKAGGDNLGFSVSMSSDGSRIVAGARQEDDATGSSTTDNGAAYVFMRSGTSWAQEQKLLASDKATGDGFGYSVAMSGDGLRVVVGAYFEDDPTGGSTTDNGAAYVFLRSGSTWTQERKLLASDKSTDDVFGFAVAMSADGSRVVVAALQEDEASGTSTSNNGAAYVFVRAGSTWTQEQKLLASDRASNELFGTSLTMSGDGARIVVGAYGESDATGTSTNGNGAAYVFVRSGSTWTQDQKLLASDKANIDGLGASAAMSANGSRVIVGAVYDDDATGTSTIDNGAAYLFELGRVGMPCALAGDCAGGFCVDGVCCESACGGAALDDCVACRETLTGVPDGTCAPLTASVAPTVTCRVSAGPCDSVEESCVAGDPVCPTDVFDGPTTICRPSAGPCDVVENCSGTSAACVPDTFAIGGVCRPASGGCDVPDLCDGSSAACPADGYRPANFECRASVGACDPPELCNGASAACPGDAYSQPNTPCRPASGACDVGESCVGGTPQCPADVFLSGNVCRAAAGVCDVAETCSGASADCPANAFVTDGTTCEDALTCSQTSACQLGVCATALMIDCSDGDACTTDSCAEPVGCLHTPIALCGGDGGVDAGADAGDASMTVDAGESATDAGGCSCRVVPGDAPHAGWRAAFALTCVLVMRARRRPGPRAVRAGSVRA